MRLKNILFAVCWIVLLISGCGVKPSLPGANPTATSATNFQQIGSFSVPVGVGQAQLVNLTACASGETINALKVQVARSAIDVMSLQVLVQNVWQPISIAGTISPQTDIGSVSAISLQYSNSCPTQLQFYGYAIDSEATVNIFANIVKNPSK